MSVAYTTRNDTLGFLSNYGATTVDLAAPGDQIHSTYAASDTSYYPPSFLNVAGTSYAAAHVSGALALLLARYPNDSFQESIARLLAATDPLPALAGKCVTGGRLNLHRALDTPVTLVAMPMTGGGPFQLRVSSSPNRTCAIEVSTNLSSWSAIFTNMTGLDGRFDFADDESLDSARRFYRAVAP